ncbi:hypothetical protein CAPTEDRAFT_18660 [Capitella teleta]|uniref:General transcription factor IIH subunit 4 n=1 Tax=Capitella teleta TaxID=283909 RepID=R7TCL4_CAPTE|nr:hypothetical protein CAPTEDRAFT_18660 [Capitella teleta]|eukprot:ELT91478.1 hypothetical protein CAPTEDRAFT_18660 [Capitella teleta]
MASPSPAKLTTKHLKCKTLHEYLKGMPQNTLTKLYNHPATCLAIFRELPSLSKHYVLRILFVEQPVSHSVVSSWVNSSNQTEHTAAVKSLSDLCVWQDHCLPGGLPGYLLSDVFRTNLKVALLGGGSPWAGSGALGDDKHSKDVAFLEQYSMERWECVLHYMAGSKEGVSGVSRDVVHILLHSGLMKTEQSSPDPCITPAGFQFLLLDTSTQVWFFMIEYLNTVESRKMDLVECLSFLFQLSFSTLGKDYSTESMTSNQQRFLQHLREFGLVYQRKRSSQRFYPTRLAVNLATGSKGGDSETASEDGFIVVETNYRVYAYTNSSLKVALISLFCSMMYRFPNMAVGVVSRDSVREALSRGITAEQIINFLRNHAHPHTQKRKPILPPTVSDQIRLWELERDRFHFNEGVLYNQFLSQTDFEVLRDYAKDLGVLSYENIPRRLMVVTRAGHDDVKRFWKRHKHD